jgi:hypothetical protein
MVWGRAFLKCNKKKPRKLYFTFQDKPANRSKHEFSLLK